MRVRMRERLEIRVKARSRMVALSKKRGKRCSICTASLTRHHGLELHQSALRRFELGVTRRLSDALKPLRPHELRWVGVLGVLVLVLVVVVVVVVLVVVG